MGLARSHVVILISTLPEVQLDLTWHSSRYLRAMLVAPMFPCSRRASWIRLPAHTSPFISSSSTLP